MTDYGSKNITFSIASDLLEKIDQLATNMYSSRSGVIRMALLSYMQQPHIAAKVGTYLTPRQAEDAWLAAQAAKYD